MPSIQRSRRTLDHDYAPWIWHTEPSNAYAGYTNFPEPWRDPNLYRQSDALLFPEDLNQTLQSPALSQAYPISGYQNLGTSGTWHSSILPDVYQFGASPFGTESQDISTNLPLEDVGFDALPMSSAWMTQNTAQAPTPNYLHDQPIMPVTSEAQPGPLSNPITAPAASAVPQTTASDRMNCPNGCAGTFRRPGDYRRHMRKHASPRFKCMMYDCDKTFYRADKLRDHIKRGHKFNF
ncbi:uncharacterized protein K460DRAFT_412133 [Cucurbitaria berberidis CBS 394.84]|uniref:C2H2-type domain-containing protein n=1 Tax=Cucurbitaria berberidis CBS 394.84 TaxID=1168544 RepID=A0A9P4GS31_9PLEO|nr:uncharacterized protein K460DRAFT_412133 [Cucurbitaria berberidis CBS 394.84]KAF1850426.1 hypothetical protein K460DRAFT_412133 [Cucurbitaria berberidis CBS 394.84]